MSPSRGLAWRAYEALERAKIAESDKATKLEGRLRGEVGGLREQLRLLADWQVGPSCPFLVHTS